jgi:hypothetical protein
MSQPSDDAVWALVAETVARHHDAHAQVTDIHELALGSQEQGWSGAALRRYRVVLQDGSSLTVLTKTMPRKERVALALLTSQGHRHTPYVYMHDLHTDGPVLTCMQDLGSVKVARPDDATAAPPPVSDLAVARALVSIHLPNLVSPGRPGTPVLAEVPRADVAYARDFLVGQVWRVLWEQTLRADAAFAREFGCYTQPLERAAERWVGAMAALWQEGTALTLTHGEVHGEHVLVLQGRPYFIDWGWTYVGPFYLDLPAYFTPATVGAYHRALEEAGYHLSLPDFLERYHAMAPYVGFKYLCSGIWQWPPGPTDRTGRRLLLMLAWALHGAPPERAFSVSPAAWQRLLAMHDGPGLAAEVQGGMTGPTA